MRLFLSAMVLAWACSASAKAAEISGSGSTFCYTVMAKWTDAYEKSTGVQVTYQPIGSSAGMKEIQQGIVDFAVSEAPLNDAQLLRDGLVQFPLLIGAVVPVVNLPGIAAGQLRLSGPLLADIFMGKVTRWNDKAITALNPDLTLPALPITVIHRTEGSGTTFVFADFLSKVSPEWKARIGVSTTLGWPVGYGGKGNGDVAYKVSVLRGGIGYIDYPYAVVRKQPFALVQNQAGKFVTPDASSFSAATEGVHWRPDEGFDVLLSNSASAEAYPIMATSFVLVRQRAADAQRARATFEFLNWALNHGGEMASAQAYLPLPATLVRQVQGAWEAETR